MRVSTQPPHTNNNDDNTTTAATASTITTIITTTNINRYLYSEFHTLTSQTEMHVQKSIK